MTNPEKLTRLMKKHNWTEAKVAEICGLAPSKQTDAKDHHRSVRRWLRQEATPAMGFEAVFMYIQKYLSKK